MIIDRGIMKKPIIVIVLMWLFFQTIQADEIGIRDLVNARKKQPHYGLYLGSSLVGFAMPFALVTIPTWIILIAKDDAKGELAALSILYQLRTAMIPSLALGSCAGTALISIHKRPIFLTTLALNSAVVGGACLIKGRDVIHDGLAIHLILSVTSSGIAYWMDHRLLKKDRRRAIMINPSLTFTHQRIGLQLQFNF